MKGIVFTEFMEMVEHKWDLDMVDDLIDAVNPPSGGAYTSVSTYPFEELRAYVIALHETTQIPVPDLLQAFGEHLSRSFVQKFPDFFKDSHSTLDILKRVDDHIHVEVRKLYPDAELPKFSYEEQGDNTLILHYESSRQLADLAHGLIAGCAKHFNEDISISREGKVENDIAYETFTLSRA